MIYVNGRFLLQNQTGVNRFAYQLCRAWANMGKQFTMCCPYGQIKDCYDISGLDIIRCGNWKSHIWEQFSLPFWFARIKGEKILVNFTGLSPIFVKNKIMTIHDLAFMANPSWYSKSYVFLYKMLTPLCATTSLKVLTVSESSKAEIISRLSLSDRKVRVINNAVAPIFANKGQTDMNSMSVSPFTDRYILAVSSIDPRKNFFRLLESLEYIQDRGIKLYVIGGQDKIYSTSINKLSKTVKQNRVKWLGRINDAELRQYYMHALCFVYPSLYEGFGIPPLEAMACGTPTVVSDIPSVREVCQNASLYVNPLSSKDIAEKINKLINSRDLRMRLISAGHQRCCDFSWEKSARVLSCVVDECLKIVYTK